MFNFFSERGRGGGLAGMGPFTREGHVGSVLFPVLFLLGLLRRLLAFVAVAFRILIRPTSASPTSATASVCNRGLFFQWCPYFCVLNRLRYPIPPPKKNTQKSHHKNYTNLRAVTCDVPSHAKRDGMTLPRGRLCLGAGLRYGVKVKSPPTNSSFQPSSSNPPLQNWEPTTLHYLPIKPACSQRLQQPFSRVLLLESFSGACISNPHHASRNRHILFVVSHMMSYARVFVYAADGLSTENWRVKHLMSLVTQID